MKVNDIGRAVAQLKEKAPQFDFTQFDLTINGEEIAELGVDMEKFQLVLKLAEKDTAESAEFEEVEMPGDL